MNDKPMYIDWSHTECNKYDYDHHETKFQQLELVDKTVTGHLATRESRHQGTTSPPTTRVK